MFQLSYLVIITFFFVVSCANIYSPSGIKGDKAKKEIKYLMDSLGLLPSFALFSGASYKCQVSSSAVSGTNDANTPSNFLLPNGFTEDLNASAGGTLFFRSTNATQIKNYNLKLLRTTNTDPTASCSLTISNNACVDTIATGNPLNNEAQIVVPFGECLAIMCTGRAYIRMINLDMLTNGVTSSPESVAVNVWVTAPEFFRKIAKIDDDIYYTNKSFNQCKKGIVEVAALDANTAFARANNYFEVTYCNQALTFFPSTDANTTAILQGNVCHLEPVNALGF